MLTRVFLCVCVRVSVAAAVGAGCSCWPCRPNQVQWQEEQGHEQEGCGSHTVGDPAEEWHPTRGDPQVQVRWLQGNSMPIMLRCRFGPYHAVCGKKCGCMLTVALLADDIRKFRCAGRTQTFCGAALQV
jgi:hypothetical protein